MFHAHLLMAGQFLGSGFTDVAGPVVAYDTVQAEIEGNPVSFVVRFTT